MYVHLTQPCTAGLHPTSDAKVLIYRRRARNVLQARPFPEEICGINSSNGRKWANVIKSWANEAAETGDWSEKIYWSSASWTTETNSLKLQGLSRIANTPAWRARCLSSSAKWPLSKITGGGSEMRWCLSSWSIKSSPPKTGIWLSLTIRSAWSSDSHWRASFPLVTSWQTNPCDSKTIRRAWREFWSSSTNNTFFEAETVVITYSARTRRSCLIVNEFYLMSSKEILPFERPTVHTFLCAYSRNRNTISQKMRHYWEEGGTCCHPFRSMHPSNV